MTHPPDNSSKDAPMHDRLPLEVFYAILYLSVGSTAPVRDLVTLQLVCRSWHDIIADASFLWGTINPSEGLFEMHKALEMAKDASLDLIFIEKRSKINQTDFFKLTGERINQWRSLVVESKQWESALDDLRTRKPPKLDTLHVTTSYYPIGETEEIVLFGGDPAPGLKDVRLVNVPICRASLHLSGLKSLHLEGIPSISAAEVITLITESPSLEILHLVSLDGAVLPTLTTPAQANFASNSPIKLAFLIELNIRFLDLQFQRNLLSTLAFPQLGTLRIGCELDENPALELGVTLGLNHLDPSMNSIASGAKMYKVTLSSWGSFAICIGGLDINITTSGDPSMDRFLETFTWLSGHLEHCDPEPSYLEWFTRHTSVTALTLYTDPFYGPSLVNVIQLLSRPTFQQPSGPTWLLPHVEVFHTNLIWIDGNRDIVNMIEGRQSASRESLAAGAKGALPKRFKEIWLAYSGYWDPASPPDTKFWLEVTQVAGGADMYWEGKNVILIPTEPFPVTTLHPPSRTFPKQRPSMTHHPDNSSKDAPLHARLPLEVFHAILYLCVGSPTPVRDLVTLQLVCRSWHDIIASASFLWGTINAAEGSPAVHKALQMAKDALLDVAFLQSCNKVDQTEFFKLAGEKIDQWRSLLVSSEMWESALVDLQTQKPPRLERLHVVAGLFEPLSNEEIDFFGGEPCPGLKDVCLVRIPFHPARLHLSGLKSLSLQGVLSISPSDVITLITESPELETLDLIQLRDTQLPPAKPTADQSDLTSNLPIHLSHLITLSLRHISLPFINFLLSTIAVPRLRFFEVHLARNADPQLAAVSTNRLGPILRSITANAQMCEVTLITPDYYIIHVGGLKITIWFQALPLPMEGFQKTVDWLSGHLKTPLLDLPLHLRLKNCQPEPFYLEWFTFHANVTKLTLYRDAWLSTNALEAIIPFLGHPSPSTWLLPGLEVFHTNFVETNGNPDIVDMLERRHVPSMESSEAEVDHALPKRFREIWLAYGGRDDPRPPPDMEFMSKVVRVAEGADVYWEGKKWIEN
ncbi:hypothetical protein FRC04_008141 [Tulasnella sp. 424]|nr:hypothetical protein FRC04_008141 [Tulasnella sp. 424]KAG8959275.1 hypothetical protein FRC05_007915 [Tulasnella sp. 425]